MGSLSRLLSIRVSTARRKLKTFLSSRKTREKTNDIITTLAVIAPGITFYHYWDTHGVESWDFWWTKWLVLALSMTILFSIQIGKKTHAIIALTLSWFLFSAINASMNKHNMYLHYPPTYKIDIMMRGAENAALLTLLLSTLTLISTHSLRLIIATLSWLSLLNSIFILNLFFEGLPAQEFGMILGKSGFLMKNASMDACFIALMIPFLYEQLGKLKLGMTAPLFYLTPVFAILATEAAMPRIMLAFLVFAFLGREIIERYTYILDPREKRKVFSFSLCALTLTIGSLCVVTWNDLADSSGRGAMWRATYDYFEKNTNHWLGFGLGSFQIHAPIIQKVYDLDFKHGYKFGAMAWLHNDWGQVLFETGIIGLILITLLYLVALYRSYDHKRLFYSLLLLAIFTTANLPFHWAMSSLAGATLLMLPFKLRVEKNVEKT